MVHRHTDNGKPQGDVDAGHRVPGLLFLVIDKAHHLKGDVSLVMIHGHHDVIPAAPGFGEHGIRGHRALCPDSLCPGSLNGRDDLLDFLLPEQTVLAAVGIQPRNCNPGVLNSHLPARLIPNADYIQHPLLLNPVAGLPQGHMGGHMDHPHVLMGQHHGIVFGSGQISINLRVAGIVMACQVHGLLIKGIGDRGIHLSVHGKFNYLLHIPERGVPAHGGHLPPHQLIHGNQTHVQHVYGPVGKDSIPHILYGPDLHLLMARDFQRGFQDTGISHNNGPACFIYGLVGQSLHGNLRSYTGRITHGNTYYFSIFHAYAPLLYADKKQIWDKG